MTANGNQTKTEKTTTSNLHLLHENKLNFSPPGALASLKLTQLF